MEERTRPLGRSLPGHSHPDRTVESTPRIIPALLSLIAVPPAYDSSDCEAARGRRDSETFRVYAASPGTTRVSPRSRGYSSQCLEVNPASLVCRRSRGVPFDRDVAALRHQVDARCPDFAVD